MSSWKIVIPEAASNLVANPSLEDPVAGVSGWAPLNAATLVRTNAKSAFGIYSLRVDPTASDSDGTEFTNSVSYPAGTYTMSFYFWGGSGTYYLLCPFLDITGVFITGGNYWQRVTKSGVPAGPFTLSFTIRKWTGNASTASFWIDGMQVEASDHATTYLDGDTPGCYWLGDPHNSPSYRPATTQGGRIYDLDTNLGLPDQESWGGVGVAPYNVIALPFGQLDGARFQRTVIQPRGIQIPIIAKGASESAFHTLRKALIDLIGRDPRRDVPLILQYARGATTTLVEREIPCVYDTGLEWTSVMGSDSVGHSEIPPLHLLAHSPAWRSPLDTGKASSLTTTVVDSDFALERDSTGLWRSLAGGFNAEVKCMAVGRDGRIYFGGTFVTAYNAAGTGSPVTCNGIACWDPFARSFTALGATPGVAGGSAAVYGIAVDAAGNLIVVGSFTTAGGVVSCNRVAKYTVSTNVWSAMQAGFNADMYCVGVAPDGSIWVGGSAATATTGALAVNYVSRWNGSAWTIVDSGVGTNVRSLCIDINGRVYIAGDFITAGGTSAVYRVAYTDTVSGSYDWKPMSDGWNGIVQSICLGDNGDVFAGGNFTANGSATTIYNASHIGRWNGVTWTNMGAGVTGGNVSGLFYKDGALYVVGSFTTIGTLAFQARKAIWAGGAWIPWDVTFPGSPTVNACLMTVDGRLFACFNTSGSAVTAQQFSITPLGNADAYPYVRITGPGRIEQVNNWTTGGMILFDYLLQTGESALLSTVPGDRSFISSLAGKISGRVLAGSKLGDWKLAPGLNNLSLYMSSATGNAGAGLYWRDRYQSID